MKAQDGLELVKDIHFERRTGTGVCARFFAISIFRCQKTLIRTGTANNTYTTTTRLNLSEFNGRLVSVPLPLQRRDSAGTRSLLGEVAAAKS
jgi:hypothetical protein